MLLLLLLLGLGGYFAWDRLNRPDSRQETAGAAATGAGQGTSPPVDRNAGHPPPAAAQSESSAGAASNASAAASGTGGTSPPTDAAKPGPNAPRPSVPPIVRTPVPPVVGPNSNRPATAGPVVTGVFPKPGATTGTGARPIPAASPAPGLIETNRRDAHGLKVHQLAKRIDTRTAEELQRELLGFREVALDAPTAPNTAKQLFEYGTALRLRGQTYPGPAIAAKNRPDLAGLPFRLGPDAVLFKPQAESLSALSLQLRAKVQGCIPAGRSDPRPDPDQLYQSLLAGDSGLFREKRWATDEAVPCIQQMLQADGPDIRRMSVELLRGIPTPAATEALVRWAVFDVESANRAAAVDALRDRDREAITRSLLVLIRYPWPRAVEHAAEALVALGCRDAVPLLAALLALADPDAPRAPELAGSSLRFRREMVRVNHARNCLMCHPPSPIATDLVRGAIPDQSQPLAPPTTPAYYTGTNQFVHASTTYLRQEFSVVLPVANPGPWPDHQRYDYLIGVYPAKDGAAAVPEAQSPFRAAILFALRELSGRDLGPATDAWVVLRGTATAPDDRLVGAAAWYLVLVANPEPVITFWLSEFGPNFLSLSPAEQTVVLARFRRTYGVNPTRYAVIAYLERIAITGDPTARAKAQSLLVAYWGNPSAVAVEADPDAAVALSLLKSKDPHVRAAAATALGLLGTKARPHYAALVLLLSDPEVEVRAAAAFALGEIASGPIDMFDALAKATADPNPQVRVAAADALVRLKLLPRSSAKLLSQGLVKKGEWDSPTQKAAFEKTCSVLLIDMKGRAADAYAIVLDAALGETPTDVPPAVLARILTAIGPPEKKQIPRLVGLLAKPEFRTVAELHLVDAGDLAVGPLARALKDENVKLRLAAVEVLGKAGARRNPATSRSGWLAAMDALATAKASDVSPEVRAAATAALKALSETP